MKKGITNIKAVSGKLKETEEKITSQSFSKDGITRSIKVREVENGFVIEITEEGRDKKEDWYWATQTWISTSNPLDSNKDGDIDLETNVSETIKNALANLKL